MKVGIIGGGIAGLTSAFLLAKDGHKVKVFETADYTAGLAGSIVIGDTFIEKYYHHIFTHDKHLLNLIEEVGLTSSLLWKETKMGYFHGGGLHSFSTPLDLLSFKPLSVINRLRFGISTILISKYTDWTKLENETAESFLLKYTGKEVYEIIWKPLLKAKFGEKYKLLPAVWIWERIVQRAKTRKNGGQKELLGYLEGGFQRVFNKVIDSIEVMGGEVLLNSTVDKIVIEEGNCMGIIVNGVKEKFDSVIVTTSLPEYVRLCQDAGENYLEPLRKVKYDGTLGVMLVMKKPVTDYYWINISDEEIPFGGIIEHTNFIPSKHYTDKSVLYFSKYLPVNDKFYEMPEKDLLDIYYKNLKKVAPQFDAKNVESYYIFKDEYAQPIWPMNYSKIKPNFKTPINNLYLANTAQIYPNDRGMNYSVLLGTKVVEEMGI